MPAQTRQTDTPGKPNLVFVFADQWRGQATGYAGDPNLQGKTPNIDAFSRQSINFRNAVSTCPVCTPYRASLITGQYPLTHGLFLNDLCLSNRATSIAEAYVRQGYDTAYIGKWHIDGHGRSNYIPPERHQGFKYWKVLECTHNYSHSQYYIDDNPDPRMWEGYDAHAQTRDAQNYIRRHCQDAPDKPFILFLSWGPPHAPYQTAPEKFRDQFPPESIWLSPNTDESGRDDLAGYYAHIAALDACFGELVDTIDGVGLRDNTIVVLTSDHGDMLGSHGARKKQQPWEESILVPFLLRYPPAHQAGSRTLDMPVGTPDIMPTLLGLSGIDVPQSVEGDDFSDVIRGTAEPEDNPVLIMCPSPFGQWTRPLGREYRGVRTKRFTYVRDLNGPWMLFDNEADPYQQENLVNNPDHSDLQACLEKELQVLLRKRNDEFLPGWDYIKEWGYTVKENGTVAYTN